MNTSNSSTWYVMGAIPISYTEGDEIIHTQDRPFCPDMTCPCRQDVEATGRVLQQFMDGLLSIDEAFAIYWGRS